MAAGRWERVYIYIYMYILTSLPRRPNHNLTAVSFLVSKPLRFLFRHLFRWKLGLGAILGGLGVVLGDLGAILGGLGAVFGRSWGDLGWFWGVLGRSWAVLRWSWAALGVSWGAPKWIKQSIRNRSRDRSESGRPKVAPDRRFSMFFRGIRLNANQVKSAKKVI